MKSKFILLISILCFIIPIHGINRQRSLYIPVCWTYGDINEFVINSAENTTAAAFLVKADILETPGEILATSVSGVMHNSGNDILWVDASKLSLRQFPNKNNPYTWAGIYLQLGAFPTPWKAGNTLRLTAMLLDNEETTYIDIRIPKGSRRIELENQVFMLPEYSLENPGQDDFYPNSE